MSKKVRVELDHDIGDKVYLLMDPDFNQRMVVEIKLCPGGTSVYTLAFNDETSEHYAIEITDTKPVI